MKEFDALEFAMQSHLGTNKDIEWGNVPEDLTLPSKFALAGGDAIGQVRIAWHPLPGVVTLQQGRLQAASLLTTGYLNFHDGVADACFLFGSSLKEQARRKCATSVSSAVIASLLRRRAWQEAMFFLVSAPCFSRSVLNPWQDPFDRHAKNDGPTPNWPDLIYLNRAISINFPIAHEFAHSLGKDDGYSNWSDAALTAAFGDAWPLLEGGKGNQELREQILRELAADTFAAEALDSWLGSQKLKLPVAEKPDGSHENPEVHIVDSMITCLLSAWLLSAADAIAGGVVSRDLGEVQSRLEAASITATVRMQNLVNSYVEILGEDEISSFTQTVNSFIQLADEVLADLVVFVLDRQELFFGQGLTSFQWQEQLTMTAQFFSNAPTMAAIWSMWARLFELDEDDTLAKRQMATLETLGHLSMSPLGRDWKTTAMMTRNVAFHVVALGDPDGNMVLRETAYREARNRTTSS